MQPQAQQIHCSKSTKLKDKYIIVGVTGSIAAVECVKLLRELVRHGAEVYPVMTEASQKIIHPFALEYAAGNKPVVELTGAVEHIALCGAPGGADMLLIAPCTANTISKIANGIDDTPVTTFATTAIGAGIPLLLVPAMHLSMYKHKIVEENIAKLKSLGVEFIEPHVDLKEGKAKLPGVDEIVSKVTRILGKGDLRGKKVLVIGGPTAESIDSMRLLTNRSSGYTGIELARDAYERGAEVKLWFGYSNAQPPIPTWLPTERFESTAELFAKARKLPKKQGYEIIIVCAAISDYTVDKHAGKLPSGKDGLTLRLKPTSKFIKYMRKRFPESYIVGFKAEWKLSESALIEKAHTWLLDAGVDLVVANDISYLTLHENKVYIIDREGNHIAIAGDKSIIAEKILDEVVRGLK
jgi:phosphopantothenoylcysteine decarboxylase/phosphopantothenate--cysteine ligase